MSCLDKYLVQISFFFKLYFKKHTLTQLVSKQSCVNPSGEDQRGQILGPYSWGDSRTAMARKQGGKNTGCCVASDTCFARSYREGNFLQCRRSPRAPVSQRVAHCERG